MIIIIAYGIFYFLEVPTMSNLDLSLEFHLNFILTWKTGNRQLFYSHKLTNDSMAFVSYSSQT
jgi:hypothetical protein